MKIKVDELKENEDGIKGGKITITTKTHTITIKSEYLDDAHYLASNLEDCAEQIEVLEGEIEITEDVKSIIDRTKEFFPGSFINGNNELIFDRRSNLYFRLDDVETTMDFKCKMFAWLTRQISKSLSDYKARKILKSFNQLLGTNFNMKDIETIYDRLGNDVNRKLCIEFIESNYDLSLLKR